MESIDKAPLDNAHLKDVPAEQRQKILIDNPNLKNLSVDVLYHLGLSTEMDLKAMFGDVKFVCMGGSVERAHMFAKKCVKELNIKIPVGCEIAPVGKTERYTLFKIGNIISVNHGMGAPSLSILLHELAKLLHHAEAKDVTFIRMGTCGGLGLEPGTVVVTEEVLTPAFEAYHRVFVLGKEEKRPTRLNKDLADAIYQARGDLNVVFGKTLTCDDFYEGQGRLDGALCNFKEDEKLAYLKEAHSKGVLNIEMEGLQFASFCSRLGINAAMMCSVLINRLKGDQVTVDHETLQDLAENSQKLAIRYIRSRAEKLDIKV